MTILVPKHALDRAKRIREISPAAADFYLDAQKLLAGGLPLAATSHLFAHCLREVNGYLLDSFLPYGFVDKDGKCTERNKIEAILESFDVLPNSKLIIKKWKDLNLQHFVHRDSLLPIRIFDDRHRQQLKMFEEVIDAVIELWANRFAVLFNKIDAIINKWDANPTLGAATEVAKVIPHNQLYLSKFFETIKNPDWVKVLTTKKFFSSPPEPVEEDGERRMYSWPQSKYLKRIARLRPEAVFHAIQLIPPTTNRTVIEDLVEATVQLEPSQIAALTKQRYKEWFTDLFFNLGDICQILNTLSRHGHKDEALLLIKEIWDRYPHFWYRDQRNEQAYSFESESIRNAFRAIVSRYPDELWEFLFKRLETKQAIKECQFSNIQVEAFEKCEDNEGELLAYIIRRSFVQSMERLREWEPHFWKAKNPLLKRLFLYLLGELHCEAIQDITQKWITSSKVFRFSQGYHEYMVLVAKAFPRLSESARNRYLKMVGDNPAPYKIDKRDKYRNLWAAKRLAVIESELDSKTASRLRNLRESAPADDPFFIHTHETYRESYPTKEEMAKLTLPDILGLQDEAQSRGIMARQAVSIAFSEIVCESPQRFLHDDLITATPQTAGQVYYGLFKAIRLHSRIDWKRTVDLANLLLRKHQERALTNSVVELFVEDLAHEMTYPVSLAAELWALCGRAIELLRMFPGEGEDAISDSEIRGNVFRLLVLFKIFASRNGLNEYEKYATKMIEQLIEDEDYSTAVLPIVAHYWNFFFYDRKEWLEPLLRKVFPIDGDQEVWRASFMQFISNNNPQQGIFPLLRRDYEKAICSIGIDKGTRGFVEERFLKHLAILYLNDEYPLSGPLNAFKNYFDKASEEERASLIYEIAEEAKGEAKKFEVKLGALWDWRLKKYGETEKKSGEERNALAHFFSMGVLGGAEALLRLKTTLEFTGGRTMFPDELFPRMKELVSELPLAVMDVLFVLAKQDRLGMVTNFRENEIRFMLKCAIESTDRIARERAKSVIHRSAMNSQEQFLDLLKE